MRKFIIGTDWWTDCDDAVALALAAKPVTMNLRDATTALFRMTAGMSPRNVMRIFCAATEDCMFFF